jgi:hypothetical protein
MPLDASSSDDPFAKYNGSTAAILFPVGERRVGWETRNSTFERINSHKAIVRMTEDKHSVHVLSVVGSGYRLVHNRELFGRVEDTLCKIMTSEDLADVRVTDKVSSYGRMCYRDYIFPNIKCVVGTNTRSTVAFRLIVQNGYGGSALRVHAGAIDFYCSNGIINGDYTSAYRKHTSGLMVEGISEAVEKALISFSDNELKWRNWSKKTVTHGEAMQLFRDLAQSAKLQENLADQYLKEREDRGHTLWAVYSALTYYASHNDGPFALRSTVEQQDTVASTMLQRELNVSQWVKSPAWRKLEAV